ncbi:MAG: YciI family protein, partial [Candidatus Acidiferrales bacterium]
MRCLVIVKASKDSEKGVMPSAELLAAMGKYNEELMKAGIIQGAAGLRPTSHGIRVRFSGAERTVIR